ncbi:MAG TPA: 23S rRNA (pseudouridine(1915)-N(3))-methyltransferase RlmH [Gammaproteobacteria bacterium]|nr:23S rRNA (pseudouridine(1915)-N(3))-methyltransferase RlmH [Gammaproteobacteria bacterium]MEC8009472.1 23S rRNA (pseudouridine(1915)-N(3))-methyltransferase RlmH [Pseudomonadota bacterium]HBF08537.1 23S rRNA (pseudouridine(1915)-N(3))-methyltransferase RlmH [Gammaproteobacteria bacterium]HCK93289.1 23S rRNA (pseudouridine(1915)-N(3))-methyltransferase RlmH [Gammaproteobacteria bacterium]|tara:strand:- start:2725 stop:3192 length:468 start_codon:yes stop_codon:yes gene_type:complete
MSIGICSISQKNPAWVDQAFQDYMQRCVHPWNIEHHHIPLVKRVSGREQKAIDKEATQVLKVFKPNDYVIGLDPQGKTLDSYEFADKIQQCINQSQRPVFVIGAPEGLAPDIRQSCREFWSLGRLTMPHTLAKVVLAEQIFRAWSITHQHPYHRQ